MHEDKIGVQLTRPEAVVLAEFLMRFRDEDRLATEHKAEDQMLSDLCCLMEKQLPELFDPNWQAIVDHARAAILTGSGR